MRFGSEPDSRGGKLYYGWVVVASGFALWAANFGLQYSFGIFFKPLQEAFGWSRATTSWAMTAHLLVFAACMLLASWALDRINTRVLFSVSAILVGSSLVLCSRISEAWQLYLLYALPLAGGMSICGPAIGVVITRWFTMKRGLALGITSAGVGLGTLVFAPATNWLIATYGWRNAFVALGIAGFLIILVAGLFMRSAPAAATGHAAEIKSVNKDSPTKPLVPRGMTFRQAIRTREMFLILVAQVFSLFTQRTIMVHITPHAIDVGISQSAAALALGTVGASSLVGRLVMGFVQDRIGPQRSLVICFAGLGVSLLALPFIRSDMLLFVFAVVFGFAYGGDVPQMPSVLAQCFGMAPIAVTYALTMSVGNVGGSLGPVVSGYVFDQTGSYAVVFIAAGLSMFVSVACIWKLRIRA